MKPCLVDVNVWLALLVQTHDDHQTAMVWFDELQLREAVLCRQTQLSVIRLLGNRTIMGERALRAAEGWRQMAVLMEDGRVEFASEPPDVDNVLPKLLRYPGPTSKLVMDSYLAAFAIAGGMRLVTMDRSFLEFREADVVLLG